MKRFPLFVLLGLLLMVSCNEGKRLPIIGPRTTLEVDGATDTLYHSIPGFVLMNQEGIEITEEDLKGNIVVADFFFTTCPSICPIMKTQMLRVNEEFATQEDFRIISISIDPRHDTIEVLKDYSQRLGASTAGWDFLTGDLDDILDLAQKGFLVSAAEDSTAPGGYIHSGAFILIDKELRIRGFYDGTKEEKVDLLMRDIKNLEAEYFDS